MTDKPDKSQRDSLPLISVIVPVYKTEKYLDRCINSITSQTYKNLEIIIVDDGSPDNCPAMCDEWAQKDSRIKVIHKENGGLSSARNAGLDAMSGNLVGFIDSDDYIAPDMYETLYRLMSCSDADLSMCSFLKADENGKVIADSSLDEVFDDETVSGEEALNQRFYSRWWYCIACNKLCRNFIFDGLRFPEGRIHEDNFIMHHVLTRSRKVTVTCRKLYMYTIRDDSITGKIRNSFSIKRTADMFAMYRERYEFFSTTGRNNLADKTLYEYYRFILGLLRHNRYRECRYDINEAILFVSKACIKSKNIVMKLRPVKLFFSLMANAIADILNKH